MAGLVAIRDPIHNYIPISRLEEALVANPLFQRLRYVSQNGLAHLVYPSNRTSRFAHSLGAMHLGGQFLLRAMANTEPSDLLLFHESANKLCAAALDVTFGTLNNLTAFLRESNDVYYRHSGLDPTNPADTLTIVLLQAVRLASLMHDLGHLPFSHTLEYVLSDAYSNCPTDQTQERRRFQELLKRIRTRRTADAADRPLHEAIGRNLMHHVFSSAEFGAKELLFAQCCYTIACEIVDAGQRAGAPNAAVPPNKLIEALHSIISSELDADRCDYVRRDGYAAGFEFGAYDLQRILNSLRFHFDSDRDRLLIVPSTIATSALAGC